MKKIAVFLGLVTVLLINTQSVKRGYNVGDKATDFRLKNVDGRMVSLTDYKTANGFIVIFDCNTCPVSKAYNARIIALHEKYASRGFPVVAINSNDPVKSPGDSFENMVEESKRKKYEFAYLFDQTQEIAQTYGATNTPHVFVLTKAGSDLMVAYIGGIDDNSRDASKANNKYVENAVDALLAGKEVPTAKTKAIGCGIKWKDA